MPVRFPLYHRDVLHAYRVPKQRSQIMRIDLQMFPLLQWVWNQTAGIFSRLRQLFPPVQLIPIYRGLICLCLRAHWTLYRQKNCTRHNFWGQSSIRADWLFFDGETYSGANYDVDPNDPDLTPIIYVKRSRDFQMMPNSAWVRPSMNANFFQVEYNYYSTRYQNALEDKIYSIQECTTSKVSLF